MVPVEFVAFASLVSCFALSVTQTSRDVGWLSASGGVCASFTAIWLPGTPTFSHRPNCTGTLSPIRFAAEKVIRLERHRLQSNEVQRTKSLFSDSAVSMPLYASHHCPSLVPMWVRGSEGRRGKSGQLYTDGQVYAWLRAYCRITWLAKAQIFNPSNLAGCFALLHVDR